LEMWMTALLFVTSSTHLLKLNDIRIFDDVNLVDLI
jgi:hypothetical protein